MPRSIIRYNDGSQDYDYPFLALRGSVQKAGMQLEEITVPGRNGQAFRELGHRAPPFEMLGEFDRGDGVGAYDNNPLKLSQLRGKVVTVFDDHGTKHDRILILDTRKEWERPVAGFVGGLMAQLEETAVAFEAIRFVMVSTADNTAT